MKLKIILLGILFAYCSVSAAFGQKTEISPEKRALIAEIVEITKADKNVEQIMQATMGQMNSMYPEVVKSTIESRDDLTPAQKAEVEKVVAERQKTFSTRFQDKFIKAINFREYIDAIIYPLYDKFFTEDELKDLLSFYKTPTGRKLNESLPQFSSESIKLSQEYLAPKLQGIIMEMLKEDTGKNIASPPPPKSKN